MDKMGTKYLSCEAVGVSLELCTGHASSKAFTDFEYFDYKGDM